MTVISQDVATIGGADNDTLFKFSTPYPRASHDGSTLITTPPVNVRPVAGVLTTPDLDPGLTQVMFGSTVARFFLPDDSDPVPLTPLLADALPVTPTPHAEPVINLGGVSALMAVTQSWWESNPHSPNVAYLVFPDPA